MDKRKKEKGLREMGAQWISEDQCADGIFGVKQTTTYESWQYLRMQWDVVASGSRMHNDDGE